MEDNYPATETFSPLVQELSAQDLALELSALKTELDSANHKLIIQAARLGEAQAALRRIYLELQSMFA
jgi:hypothetical protein